MTHRVLPLDHTQFGRLPRQTVRSAEIFYDRTLRFADEQRGRVEVMLPFAPDSNLVCVALNPAGNASVQLANDFVRQLHDILRCDPRQPVQTKQFFGSMTSLRPELLGAQDTARILNDLGLDPAGLDEDSDQDRLLILRHTLMNPYLIDHHNGINYIDRYFEFLDDCMTRLLAASSSGNR